MKEDNRAKDQARAQLDSIIEMIDRLRGVEESENYYEEDDIRQEIAEDPLSVEVRSGWGLVHEELEPCEFKILLCWGGPAVQIIGDLDEHNQPENAEIQYQDWFTRWRQLIISDNEERYLLEYSSQFYFGEY